MVKKNDVITSSIDGIKKSSVIIQIKPTIIITVPMINEFVMRNLRVFVIPHLLRLREMEREAPSIINDKVGFKDFGGKNAWEERTEIISASMGCLNSTELLIL